jgi:hypothetical protein
MILGYITNAQSKAKIWKTASSTVEVAKPVMIWFGFQALINSKLVSKTIQKNIPKADAIF